MKSKDYSAYWAVVIAGILFYFYEYFLRTAPGTVLNDLSRYFELSAGGITLLLSTYFLPHALLMLPAGLAFDRFPLKLLLALAAFLCAASTLLFIITDNADLAIIGRILMGGASSFVFIGTLKAAFIYLPKRVFTPIAAIMIAVGMLTSTFIAPIVHFLSNYSWQIVFKWSLSLGIMLGLVFLLLHILLRVSDKKTYQKHIDRSALMRLFKNPYLWINGLVAGLFYMPISIMINFWGAYYVVNNLYFQLADNHYWIGWLSFGWAIGSIFMIYISAQLQKCRGIISCSALISAFMFVLIFTLPPTTTPLIPLLLFCSGFFGSAQVLTWRILIGFAPQKLLGSSLGVTQFCIISLSIAFQLVLELLLNHSPPVLTTLTRISPLNESMLLLPLCLMFAGILVWRLPECKRKLT